MKNVDEKIKLAEQIKRHANEIIALSRQASGLGLSVHVSISCHAIKAEPKLQLTTSLSVWESLNYLSEIDGKKVTE